MTEEPRILPCPFCPCGGDPTLGEALDFGSTGENFGKGWTVTCNVCCTQNGLSRTAKEAIRHWNTRSTPAIADGAYPDMPAAQIRLHFGELTNNEIRLVRAAIRFANSQRADGVGVEWKQTVRAMLTNSVPVDVIAGIELALRDQLIREIEGGR